MKTFTIITLILNVLALIAICAFIESDPEAAVGWGVIATFFTTIYFAALLSSKQLDEKEAG